MRMYKVIEHYIRKNEDGSFEPVTYDCNFDWTADKDKLNKDVTYIQERIPDITFEKGYLVQYDSKCPYEVIEKEAETSEINDKKLWQMS